MDEDLRAIREARLQELKQRSGQRDSASAGGSASGGQTANNEAMASLLSQILEPSAQERLSRVALVRPERVRAVEQYLVQSFQSGAIRNKLKEADIVSILASIGRDEQRKHETRIIFNRREYAEENHRDAQNDSEDDFFDE